jgi:hypothetical protein
MSQPKQTKLTKSVDSKLVMLSEEEKKVFGNRCP